MSTAPQTESWAYFDCFSGISGDMTLGAFIDLGLEAADLERLFQEMGFIDLRLKVNRVMRQHLSGLQVKLEEKASAGPRGYQEICRLIDAAPLSPAVKDRSLGMIRRLGEVEARIHGQKLDEVHFHELGAVDTVVDTVGVSYALEKLGITKVFCSSLPLGWGMIAAAHGRLPNPAPAALELLKGLPVYGTDLPGELITPTGAAILQGCGAEYEPCPPLILSRVGYGAGSRELPGHPNLLRVWLGTPLSAPAGVRERVVVLETHIDDMNPEWYEPLMAGLFAAGALDVALTPIQMKKNRPGVALTVIAPPVAQEGLLTRMFINSTTLGVRISQVERVTARRWQETRETPYGPLEVKVMEYGGRRRILPEYEACRKLAAKHNLPLIEVYRLVPAE